MDLPPEVILEMLSCINTQADLRAVSRTCKKLRSYNEAFQWQSLHVIISKAGHRQKTSMIDQSNTSFKIVAENAPGRLLEACHQGRIPCGNVRQIKVTSLSPANDFPNIQSDYNKMFARFPRLNILLLDMPPFALKLPSELPIRRIKADFGDYINLQEWGKIPESLNVMVHLETLARLPYLKTLHISCIAHSEAYRPFPEYSAYMEGRGSTIEDLRLSLYDDADDAVVLALLAWPNALKHLSINLYSLYRHSVLSLFSKLICAHVFDYPHSVHHAHARSYFV